MQFLEIARKSLMEEFRELRGCSSENLLYIKEDLIIPHDMTFHYLIETKARGKSGPVRWHASVLCVLFASSEKRGCCLGNTKVRIQPECTVE